MADGAAPQQHFIHTQATHFTAIFFFYAYGNTPPTDLLQHVPHDASRAEVLSLGCSDLRDLLYSLVLHGRRGVKCGPVPRQLSFVINDWEPAIHARNLMLLQMILDSRSLLEEGGPADADDVTCDMDALAVGGGSGDSPSVQAGREKRHKKKKAPKKLGKTPAEASPGKANAEASPGGVAFAQRIGVIFSAMYNMFVDADMLETIHDVAGRLAALAASPAEWASTELGRIVRFADDRSQDRVRRILAQYMDGSFQEKEVFLRVRKERSSFLSTYMVKGNGDITSRAMGLASLCQPDGMSVNAKMRRQYLGEGILDPFPLLVKGPAPAKPRGPFRKVNPLLLLTEKKGAASSLHYGAFPLDAFHTDVSWWKLRPENLQDEYGKLAPRVTKRQEVETHNCPGSRPKQLSAESLQSSWFGTALEELAQMCGAFLAGTATAVKPKTASTPKSPSTVAPHLSITLQVGDSLNFCDALMTASLSPASVVGNPRSGPGTQDGTARSPGAVFEPVSFQQGSVEPLHLRAGVFAYPPEFDVISTTNLAEHLGITNLLVATAPLLKTQPHAVLLTSLMSSLIRLHRFKSMVEFQESLLCMSSRTAGILLGVVPASSLASVTGHADTMTLLAGSMGSTFSRSKGTSESAPSQLRLVWKRPTATFAEAVPSAGFDLVDISPSDLIDLTLPVYKAMLPFAGPAGMTADMMINMATTANHYTSVSFIRLLTLAARRLRLTSTHYRAVLHALMNDSGMMLASNLSQEQMALFHALDVARMRASDISAEAPPSQVPVDTRRAVLLVPKSGLNLLREFALPGVYMSVTGATKHQDFDNHFASVHMAYVRVHRGGGLAGEGGGSRWRSLNNHLSVRDTRDDDPEAELMVSVLLPTVALMVAVSSVTELQLRPRESLEIIKAPKNLQKRLGGLHKTFYRAGVNNADRVAIMTPGSSWGQEFVGAPPPLACPKKGLAGISDEEISASSKQRAPSSSVKPVVLHRSVNGHSIIEWSVELINQAGRGNVRLAYKVTLNMANDHARGLLAGAEAAPEVLKTRDPCSVRVKLAEGLTHTTLLPFPAAKKNLMKIKRSKLQGYVHLTIPLMKGVLQTPFSLTAYGETEGAGHRVLPSTLFWPPCAPLSSLPRLDFKAEWAHDKVMGSFSLTHAEVSLRDETSTQKTGGVDPAFLGLKESIMAIATMACERHDDDRPIWTHPWVCMADSHGDDKPAIWVWVNEILLDSSNEALVLDCCIMPVDRLDDPASLQLKESIAIQDDTSVIAAKAYPGELNLWAKLLPVAVERARQTYSHTANCAYAKSSDTSPTLCSCGRGKDLPPDFMHSIELANAMGERVPVHTLVYRAALSPVYAPPDQSSIVAVVKTIMTAPSGCAECGEKGKSMKCTRCRKVSYCSKECQVQHWRKHKPFCK